MQEKIQSLLDKLLKAQQELEQLKPEFKIFITNKEVPLDVRWNFWVAAPDSLKGGYGWISAGRLKAFKIIGVDDPTEYEGMFWWERYERKNYQEYLDAALERLAESEEGQYSGILVWDEALDAGDYDKWIARNPVVQEFIRQFKEEVLASGNIGFKYDW